MSGSYRPQVDAIRAALARTPGWVRLRAVRPDLDDDLIGAVLEAAAQIAEHTLAPLNRVGDTQGCRLVNGRVVLPDGFRDAWRVFRDGGWCGLDLPTEAGGQDLPVALQAACQSLFDRANIAFGMMVGSSRAAARLLQAHGDPALRDAWLPQLAAGTWTATICMSEADAGSDVGRLRTRARRDEDGSWRVTGEKTWISFGDHDAAERIGHCLLARTSADAVGTRGLSLFLVPDTWPDGLRNGITVARLEEKLGLHGSPTCVLVFDEARAHLVGAEGRGLSQLFSMIGPMRLATAVQGLGLASGAAALARAYAAERRQGGPPDRPAVPILAHADVARQVAEIDTDVAILRELVLELATRMDLATLDPDATARDSAADVLAWLLPIGKDKGGRAAFTAADRAIQVLGGAGFTREWAAEQTLRDSRVLTIYEGTTGIQALDLLHRRLWRDEGRPFQAWAALARAEAETAADDHPTVAGVVLDAIEALDGLVDWFGAARGRGRDAEAGATALADAAFLGVSGLMALRLVSRPATPAEAAMGRLRLASLAVDMAAACHRARQGSALVDAIVKATDEA